jgi:hypothetical protein
VGATASERSKADHEEVQTREWNHVDSKLSQVARMKHDQYMLLIQRELLTHLLSWPGKRRQVVTPDMTVETKWLRSP